MAILNPRTVTLKDGQTVCIRSPLPGDAESVLTYLEAIFQDDRFFLTTTEEAGEWNFLEKQKERIQTYHDDDGKLIVVTEANGRIVSMSHTECAGRKRTRHVADTGISILPEYRGLGLGTSIMQAMIDWAAAHPVIEKLALEVWAGNQPAIRLYEKMGFCQEGRKLRYAKFADNTCDDCLCMYRFVK